MNIDSIQNGVVLDHIQAGKSMDIYRYLHLDELDCSVAIIKNVRSGRMGKKDIIKIDSPMEVDLDVLGYIDPNITVNIIRNGVRVEKKHLELPKKLVNIIHCKNPRCITVAEPQLDAIFLLSDPATHTYRCAYCRTDSSAFTLAEQSADNSSCRSTRATADNAAFRRIVHCTATTQ